jgi:hypothetical protein
MMKEPFSIPERELMLLPFFKAIRKAVRDTLTQEACPSFATVIKEILAD